MINLQDILLDWKKDSKIDKNNIAEEALRTSRLHAKYLEILSVVKTIRKTKTRKLAALKHNKKAWMAGRLTKSQIEDFGWPFDAFNGVRVMKTEFDAYIKNDPDVAQLQDELDDLTICQETLLDIVSRIAWRSQDLRIAVDWTKFEAGA